MRRWQKDEIFLFKLKNNNPKVKSQNRNFPEMNNPENMCKSPVVSNNNIATASENPEQPVKRMAKLAGFFGVMNSKQEEKNNSEAEVKELFNMLHVMSNSKEEATKHIIHFIHSNDVIIGNSVKEGWLYMQVGKYWFNSWCYKDNNGGFNIKNWKSGDIMRIMVSDIVLAELMEGKSSGSSGDNVFQIVVKKPGSRSSSQYLFKAKYVIDAIEWVTSLKPSNAAETQKVIIEDDSNFKENFDALNIIGKGKYSVVFLCKQLATQEPYAVKILNCQYKDMWEVEKDILKSISHPFIVDIFQAFEYEEHNYLVMDFINGGDLYFHLSQYGRFSELRVRFYAAEILLALESLHGHDIIYRDLKLENIMITKEGHIKIIDFGQSVPKLYMNVDEVSSMSNIEYIAPEILCGKPYSFASDWWAYGVILYEMLCEKHPFYSNQKEEIVQRILQSPIEFPEYPSRYIKDLILKLLNRDSDKRLGCSCDGGKEIENHPFFEKIDFTKLYHLEIKPPFKPNVEDSFDIQYFDTQFTEEPISNNISEGNIYNKNDYNYDEDKYEEDKYDIYNEDNDNNYYKRESNDYDYERNECYQDDNDYYNDSNNYDNHDYEENDNEYDKRPRSKRYSTINHYSINYDHKDESMNYINEYEENGNISIEQQRLNNGWGSDDDEDIIDDSYNKPKQYSRDEEDYTKSYIETQEQRIKNGW
ncbi:kinase-like protein [Piromyces finnis]|uniref:Kinase-like protein n=1 Tax=Piromyces finnis TaxID=1754191 RepID=A0A1Y1VMW6_9FUNG|nr:kinase-like protein [Piromyces finnis]|eukprot:ORX60119.1 kinase-like protein [Piromyces finnis]